MFKYSVAYHSTAKTYRKVINYVKDKVPNLKLIGLTATPFRTAEEEQGLLGKIYSDGVSNGQVVRGDIGITYQIGLKELINRQILSKPIFESYFTEENYGDSLGLSHGKGFNILIICRRVLQVKWRRVPHVIN